MTFSLSRPRNLSVEVNGDIFHNLHLFANPIDKFRPSDKEIQRALKKKKGSNLFILLPVCIIFLMILYLSPQELLFISMGELVFMAIYSRKEHMM